MSRREAKRKTCTKCNKSIKRLNWYYRDGKYFCGKGCYKNFSEKA